MPIVRIPTKQITDWTSFHHVFAEVMGFPDFYGRNMNAWIDCMTSLDSPDDGMTKIHCAPPDVVVLHLEDLKTFREKHRELYDAVVECSSFVNYRRLEMGDSAVLEAGAPSAMRYRHLTTHGVR
jgi:RNAse (barnase) inhibitor barstar